MHFLLNVITQSVGVPEGVLLRAAMAEGQPARWLAGPA
jgi:3-methyladenine DNA glycosylase Mpg